jgi:hypothetical protein
MQTEKSRFSQYLQLEEAANTKSSQHEEQPTRKAANTKSSQHEEPSEKLRTMQHSPGFDSLQPGSSKPLKSSKRVKSCQRKSNCSDIEVDTGYNIMESLCQNKIHKESRDE